MMQRTRSSHKFAVASAWFCGMLVSTPHPPHTLPTPTPTPQKLLFSCFSCCMASPAFLYTFRVTFLSIVCVLYAFLVTFLGTVGVSIRAVRLYALYVYVHPYHTLGRVLLWIPPNFDTLTRVFVLSAFECHRNLCTLTRNVCSVDITEFLDAFYVYPPDHPLYRRSRVDLQVRGVESRESTYYCFCVHTRTCVCACVRACARVFLFLVSLGSSPQHVPRANIQTCMHMHM